jgi:hypothetical protein
VAWYNVPWVAIGNRPWEKDFGFRQIFLYDLSYPLGGFLMAIVTVWRRRV